MWWKCPQRIHTLKRRTLCFISCMHDFSHSMSSLFLSFFLLSQFISFDGNRFQKRAIESATLNKAMKMIDIDNIISFNNNINNRSVQPTPNGGASSTDDADKIPSMPLAATTMTTAALLTTSTANNSIESNDNNDNSRRFYESSASYANGFNIETIALLSMFIVCTIIYSSKYRMPSPSSSTQNCNGDQNRMECTVCALYAHYFCLIRLQLELNRYWTHAE